ncbi:hypothetical protein [Bradyrhizobium sp. SZCCHNRI1058]|uniref:hypothetical protein n=1 Tax=Bradyrhizobium sp. SZCCHNRI1058 TaxID=3057279 RepID=UPI002916343C|nr:hypothetical protein [Bradyrhizobium sp. SZCCHNRI1058]
MTFRAVAGLVLSGKRLSKAIADVHLKERRALGLCEKAQARLLTDRIQTLHRERFQNLVARHAAELAAERARYELERKAITLARAKDYPIHDIENLPPPRYRIRAKTGACRADPGV